MGEMNVILSLNNYSIYKNDSYYLCIPNENYNFYHVFIGFSLEDFNILSDELIINEIRKISDSINAVYKNSVYILPIIKPEVLVDAIIATEDARFYQHNGVDLPRFLKASITQVLGNGGGGAGKQSNTPDKQMLFRDNAYFNYVP